MAAATRAGLSLLLTLGLAFGGAAMTPIVVIVVSSMVAALVMGAAVLGNDA